MRKYLLITLSFILLLNSKIFSQGPECHRITCFSSNSALLNSCEEFNVYTKISGGPLVISNLTVTCDFGDGSTPIITNYASLAANAIIYLENTHAYSMPGTFIATLTAAGYKLPDYCVASATVAVEVIGGCEPCSTYAVLSTGYNPGTSLPITSPPPNGSGGTDPNWSVVRRFDLIAPSYTPDINTMINYTSIPANVIYPKNGYCPVPPLGRSRYISYNSSHFSTYSTPNIYTYRRYFTLPTPLPSSTLYSLLMSIQAEDYIFDVQLNGGSILSNSLSVSGGATQVSINSCSGLFQAGSNFIDITVADINGGSTQLDAEVLLYDCPLLATCSTSGGWTYNWSWNTSWGYGWFYYWSYWYCVTYGPVPGGTCPPTWSPSTCTSCGGVGGVGIGGGWYWVFVSGWGWMWMQGGSSGSGSISCPNCIASFAPIPGNKYLLSAWVKEKNPSQATTTYTKPEITVLFPLISQSVGPFTANGNIIDGWQRLEAEFTIPASATNMDIKLDCLSSDCYYDDIRILPFDGSMKSYVYDPVNLRLVAELDERNFATLYEYDEEGKLIRVKKETEKGKMTIKENRDNTKK